MGETLRQQWEVDEHLQLQHIVIGAKQLIDNRERGESEYITTSSYSCIKLISSGFVPHRAPLVSSRQGDELESRFN